MKKKKNIIIHDYINNIGGGENLIKNILDLKFKLIVGFKNIKLKKYKLVNNATSLTNFKYYDLLKLMLPLIFYFKLRGEYQNLIASGNYSVFFKKTIAKRKIFYCHSLPKFFFKFENFYKKNTIKYILHLISKKLFIFFYIKTLNKFNFILTNSIYTQKQIKKYINKKIHVVYPPIDCKKIKFLGNGDFFLSNNRHEREKNLDVVIKVFNRLKNKKLILTSYGTQTKKLKLLAKYNKNIIFKDHLRQSEYYKLIGNCLATINITSNEDFGMASIEGMAAGKVSIVLNQGGYNETCINNYNSFVLKNNQNYENQLYSLIKKKKREDFLKLKKNCIKTSKKFSKQIFLKKISKYLI
jgi:glycosyltransferase involved in cell wall biosynthesis